MKKILLALLIAPAVGSVSAADAKLTELFYDDAHVFVGQTNTLNWSSVNATQCVNSNGTQLALNGPWTSQPQMVAGGPWRKTLTCSNGSSSDSKYVDWTVTQAELTVTPANNIAKGDIISVTWPVKPGYTCNIYVDNVLKQPQSTTEPRLIYQFTGAGNHTLRADCSGGTGVYSATKTISVLNKPVQLPSTVVVDAVTHWREKFDDTVGVTTLTPTDHITTTSMDWWDSSQMYRRWPAIDGALDLFWVTKDESYLEKATTASNTYFDAGKISSDPSLPWNCLSGQECDWLAIQGFKTWWNSASKTSSGGSCASTYVECFNNYNHEHRAGAAIAMTYLASNDGNLKTAAENHIWNKWDSWEVEDDTWKSINKMNQPDVVARIGLLAMALGKDETGHSGVIGDFRLPEDMREWLEDNRRADKSAQLIPKFVGQSSSSFDVSHAGDVVSFVVEAAERGMYGYNIEHIWYLINTVKELTHKGGTFSRFVDGTGTGVWAENQGGWIKLARYDSDLRSIYAEWADNSSNLLPSGSPGSYAHFVNAQIYGNLARAFAEKSEL